MTDSDFINVMHAHDDENLILALKNRDGYNSDAINAAVKVAIERGLVQSWEEVENLYPNKEKEIAEKELLKKEELQEKQILYKNRFKYFFIINVIFYISYASKGHYYAVPLWTVFLAAFNMFSFSNFLAKTIMILTFLVPGAMILFILADAIG